jgi:nucleotide-binding universal stress UspA family protein
LTTPVICGLDTDGGARATVAVARAMAQGFDLPLLLVHVAAGATPGADSEAVQLLREAAAGTATDVAWTVERGHPADRLVELAQEHDAAFVVVGCHGPRASTLGSISIDISRRAPCPVVVVPPGVAAAVEGEEPVAGMVNS